ncbi:preprotein translocase subunit SecE [Legionella israelensis]|uniref:Protein translocase subunit SecE n=1 Tax=Legionella israelensis TaxID=454 RepID=A0A0W0VIM9_9GAMM|nr:preprotein translocase subunit SecE [Legionella israelensis]KTD19970.1 preprotein translocase subunit SecE [Legionella israelensis]QBS09899.1 preprotein translocase subunit SecE [Legionella israelensis]QDP71304.1 preprotein translocase subunit SecE [Legionella israelensis]SCY44004.1 protein translocase subunit secE/sec61 gamma [Legionella israelensis DSM 19235]STX59461.1 preprotein translocase subunit SecE [Legionella israelensis]
MKSNVDSASKLTNTFATLAIIILTAVAFYCSYYLNFSSAIKAILWIGWLVIVLGLGLLTSKGKQILKFAKEAKIELQKVVWPSRQETVQTTSIVMIMVAITGFVLWGVDSAMMWIIGKITHLG